MNYLKMLRICFVIYGLVMSTQIIFVFIPNSAMIRIGDYFDLPEFEVTPVFEYMARCMPSLCFMIGVLLIYLGLNLQQFAPLIRLLGWLTLASIPMIIFIHGKIDTPFWWKVGDVFGVSLLCVMCFLAPRPKKFM